MSGTKQSPRLKKPVNTRARRKLIAWMAADPKARTQVAIAKRLGVSQPAVSGWLRGIPRPDDDSRALIDALTQGDVPAEDWETSKERHDRLHNLERVSRKGAA